MIRVAICRSSLLGLMKAAMVMIPVSTNSLPISAMRRISSTRSSAEKPKLLLMPLRILSPSNIRQSKPRLCNSRSKAMAIVLLPEPLSPVSHSITPRCPSSSSLSFRESIRSNIGYMFSSSILYFHFVFNFIKKAISAVSE